MADIVASLRHTLVRLRPETPDQWPFIHTCALVMEATTDAQNAVMAQIAEHAPITHVFDWLDEADVQTARDALESILRLLRYATVRVKETDADHDAAAVRATWGDGACYAMQSQLRTRYQTRYLYLTKLAKTGSLAYTYTLPLFVFVGCEANVPDNSLVVKSINVPRYMSPLLFDADPSDHAAVLRRLAKHCRLNGAARLRWALAKERDIAWFEDAGICRAAAERIVDVDRDTYRGSTIRELVDAFLDTLPHDTPTILALCGPRLQELLLGFLKEIPDILDASQWLGGRLADAALVVKHSVFPRAEDMVPGVPFTVTRPADNTDDA